MKRVNKCSSVGCRRSTLRGNVPISSRRDAKISGAGSQPHEHLRGADLLPRAASSTRARRSPGVTVRFFFHRAVDPRQVSLCRLKRRRRGGAAVVVNYEAGPLLFPASVRDGDDESAGTRGRGDRPTGRPRVRRTRTPTVREIDVVGAGANLGYAAAPMGNASPRHRWCSCATPHRVRPGTAAPCCPYRRRSRPCAVGRDPHVDGSTYPSPSSRQWADPSERSARCDPAPRQRFTRRYLQGDADPISPETSMVVGAAIITSPPRLESPSAALDERLFM